MQRNGSATSSRPATSRQATLTSEASLTCEPTTSGAIPNVISSPASEGGHSPSVLQDGPMTDLFGQEAAPANPSASLRSLMVERKARAMKGISGRNFAASSESESLTQSLASRLTTLSHGDGGTPQRWTLRLKHTPARRRFFEQTVSAQYISESGSSGWPTPAARDGKDISRSNAFLSQRQRHSPSMATRWLERGGCWQQITTIYCLAMGYPSQWNDARPRDTATRLSRKSPPSSSKRVQR